jgi:hypothetical protein
VLITTQNQHWPPGLALDVAVLDVEVAAGFLMSRTSDPDRPAARELAEAFGGLPLALEQAAAYMQASGTSLGRYLTLFRARQADLLARGEAVGHPADVVATLSLGLSRLASDAPGAVAVLRLLAFLAAEPVPLSQLLASPATDPAVADTVGPLAGDLVAVGYAVAALRRYSLALAADGLVLVHRLVQAVTRDHLPVGQVTQWQHTAAALGTRRPAPASGVAGMRGAAASRPGRLRPDQQRHLADRAGSGLLRQLPGRPGSVRTDHRHIRTRRYLRP